MAFFFTDFIKQYVYILDNNNHNIILNAYKNDLKITVKKQD